MKILALEFSSPARSVAVAVNGDVRCSMGEQRGRSVSAFGLIERVLLESALSRDDIECVAIGTGPGSYAGIRIAIAIAQGWQLARPVKVIGISSADCTAARAVQNGVRGRFHIGIDAQRGELFVARYEVEGEGARLCAPFHRLEAPDAKLIAGGETLYRSDLLTAEEPGSVALPADAASLARLAGKRSDFVAGAALEPIYVRPAEFVKAPPPKFAAD